MEHCSARHVQWGLPGDIPVVADYDGDFIDDIAIFRPSNSQWWVLRSSDGETYALQFGLPGDKPVPADYDGDGAEDVAVYRPSDGACGICGSRPRVLRQSVLDWLTMIWYLLITTATGKSISQSSAKVSGTSFNPRMAFESLTGENPAIDRSQINMRLG